MWCSVSRMTALAGCLAVLVAAMPVHGAMAAESPVRVMIIDGSSNHDFRGTSAALLCTLASARRFGDWTTVLISRSPTGWELAEPRKPADGDAAAIARYEADMKVYDEARRAFYKQSDLGRTVWRPPFEEFDVVVVNYNGGDWPEHVKTGFVEFVRNGGGVVVVHSANNPFENWPAYNEMLGIGWRGATFGTWIGVDSTTGKLVSVPEQKPGGSSHADFKPFLVKNRDPAHPIMAGVPETWMHAADELYVRMRGTADNLHVIATSPSPNGPHEEPVVWWVPFGKGRVVTMTMGHYQRPDHSTALQCVGFQTIFARACEWAATGKVTIPVPSNFPTSTEQSVAASNHVKWGW
jgi:hypothetical protein